MRIAYNPKTSGPLPQAPGNNDITFDLAAKVIYARGTAFDGKAYKTFKKHDYDDDSGGWDGLVPAPSYSTANVRLLREDGQWVHIAGISSPDQELDEESINSVENKVITKKINELIALIGTKAVDVYKNIKVGNTTIVAKGVNDTLEFIQGNGIMLVPNNKTISISINTTGDQGIDISYENGQLITKITKNYFDSWNETFNWYKSITDENTNEYIDKWQEIVDFLDELKKTDGNILDQFVTVHTDQIITGLKTFSTNGINTTIENGTVRHYISTDGGWARGFSVSNTSGNTTVIGSFGVYGEGIGTGDNKIGYLYASHQDQNYDTAVLKIYKDAITVAGHEVYHKGNLKNLSDLNDDIVSGKYLPLSGGTVSGNLSVDGIFGVTGYINVKQHYLFVRDNDNADWIVTNKDWTKEYTIIHSGNIGSQSVGNASTADRLDGLHKDEIVENQWNPTIDLNTIYAKTQFTETSYNNAGSANITNLPFAGAASTIITTPGNYGFQIAHQYNSATKFKIRGFYNSTFYEWKTLAFTDSSITGNAATASQVYINNSTTNKIFPVIFTNIDSCGTPRNDNLYVDNASGAGYNPSTNAFVASTMTASTHNSTSTLYLDSGTATTSIIFRIGGTEKVRIAQPNGYLGINTTTITYPLTVNGTAQVNQLIVSTANQYREVGGIILNNSDIWGLNAIYTSDLAEDAKEGYQFKRSNGNYDSLWCKDGVFYFSPNGNATDGYSNNTNILKAITSITRSGTTFTYTCLDGTTGTFTQQDNNSTYAVYGKTIDASYKTAYRTQTKGNTTNGYYISAIRCDTASVSGAPQYGSGMAFGMGDTHGYLYMNYSSANAYIGAGNADKLNWTATLLHSENSSVSGGGSTWGSSITVKINGTSKTLTIPANPNTWRGITDSYTGTETAVSLSQKGANNLYKALLNGYASSAGNSTKWGGYNIVVGSAGTDANTIYFVL